MMTTLHRYQPTRRTVLIGAGAATVLAIGWTIWPRSHRLNLAVREGEHVLNGWVKLDNQGRITVIVPQAEMGQGVFTSLPQILADELGADWRMVGVEPAPLHPIYANRVITEGMAAGLPGFLQGIGRWAEVEIAERLALQVTGGSNSVRAFYDPLRLAGAAAREMLCKAAARKWDIDWTSCDTADGHVVHQAQRIAFRDLSGDVDPNDAPSEPTLRGGAPRLIGKSVPRLDVPSKVDGSARFGGDVRLPGMVYAAVRAGPVGAPAVKAIERNGAKSVSGVIATVEGPGFVAAVANNWWAAEQGVRQIKARFEETPLADSAAIDAALKQAAATEGQAFREEGDIDEAREAGKLLRADYSVPFLAHACLEPMTATVRITDGRAEVWAPTQSATLVNWQVAEALDLSEDDVTVYPTLVGGGFGRKVEADACVQAALIAREVGRPVQLVWSRTEDLAQDKFRPAARARMSGRVDADKRIALWDALLAAPPIDPSFMGRNMPALAPDVGPSAAMLEGALDLPYAASAIRIAHAAVDTPVPLGPWRSVGHSYSAFFNECFVDELAHAAGVDPLTFRLRLLADRPRHAEVLKVAASRGGFLGAGGDGIARGLAVHESFGSVVAQVAEVEVDNETGVRVRRVTCAIDCGRVINPDIVRQQMEGAIIFGLTAALHGRMTFRKGWAEQTNFDGYPLLTMAEAPEIDVHILASDAHPTGVGEPGVPPIAPAVANAIFAATGERIRDLPLADKLRR